MPPESSFIRRDRADQLISEIENPATRNAIRLLVAAVVEFYDADPSRLQSSFDLAFFVEVLKYDIGRVSKLMRKIVPPGYWGDPEPAEFENRPTNPHLWKGDAAEDVQWTGLRIGQARNYCVLLKNGWIAAALQSISSMASLRQAVTRKTIHHPLPGKQPIPPGVPEQPLDYLFLVMALDQALQSERPARLAVEALVDD
jgi:hypothetical protein